MSSKQTSKTKSDPWAPAQPGLKSTLQTADDWQTNWQDRPMFQGPGVAAFDPSQIAALNGIDLRAQEGSPLVDQSKDYTSRVMGGEFLDAGNPNFQRLTEAITRGVMPGVNATFGSAGRTGSPAGHQYTLTKALGDTMAPIAFQNYENERTRQQEASQFAPQLANQDYYDLDRQFAAGAVRQGQSQSELTDEIQRYYQEQYRPFTAAQEASQLTVPIASLGGTSSTTTKTSANPLTSILGGAMMAYGGMNPGAGAMMGGALGGGGVYPMAAAAPRAPATYVPPPTYSPMVSSMYYGGMR